MKPNPNKIRRSSRSEFADGPLRKVTAIGFCLFAAIALFFQWEEHKAHVLGALPCALLLLCPIIHLFMHRGHGNHGQVGGHDAHAQHRHEGGGS
jgi:hypothetical protein